MPTYKATIKILIENVESKEEAIGKLYRILVESNDIDFGYLRKHGKAREFPQLIDADEYLALREASKECKCCSGECEDCKNKFDRCCGDCNEQAEQMFDEL